jgi:hypothetical protein
MIKNNLCIDNKHIDLYNKQKILLGLYINIYIYINMVDKLYFKYLLICKNKFKFIRFIKLQSILI